MHLAGCLPTKLGKCRKTIQNHKIGLAGHWDEKKLPRSNICICVHMRAYITPTRTHTRQAAILVRTRKCVLALPSILLLLTRKRLKHAYLHLQVHIQAYVQTNKHITIVSPFIQIVCERFGNGFMNPRSERHNNRHRCIWQDAFPKPLFPVRHRTGPQGRIKTIFSAGIRTTTSHPV